MRILLLGATGRTGKWLLKEALDKGHTVHVLVRDKNRLAITAPNLHVFEGLPTDSQALRPAITGCDAVISALNISRVSDFPWSKLRTPPYLLSQTMELLVKLCKEMAIHRLIICSAWGVAETKKDLPGWFRWFIDHSNIGAAYEDHERQEKLLQDSGLDWVIVRPAGLTNGTTAKTVRTSIDNNPSPSLTISRKNLARFMIAQLGNDDFTRKAVVVSQ